MALISISATYLFYLNFFQTPALSRREFIPTGISLVISLAITWLFVERVILPAIRKTPNQLVRKLLAIGLGIGIAAAVLAGRPPQNYRLLPNETLVISTILPANPLSSGNRITLNGFDTRLHDISYSTFALEGEWERVDNTLIHNSLDTASISWNGKTGSLAVLYFQTGVEGGKISVSWNGEEQIYDLYSENAGELTIEQKFQIPFTNYLPAYLSTLILSAFLFFSAAILLFSVEPKRKNDTSLKNPAWTYYAIPMILVWGIFLLVFWPGMMSPDSMDQWGQISSGIFDDSHPIAHTLLMWLITRIWFSPAAVAIFQILFLTLAVAWGIGMMRELGLPNWAAWFLSALFALSPINANMVITLWKDIPYSTALFLFSLFFFQVILTKGNWLRSLKNCFWLIMTGLMIALFRHNGFPVPIISLFLLPLIFRINWKRILICLAAIVLLWISVRWILYDQVDVARESGKEQAVFLHSFAAYVVQKTPMDESTAQIVNDILPEDLWTYDCCSIRTTYQNELFSWEKTHEYGPLIRKQLLSFITKNPGIEIKHLICSSSLVWEVRFRCGMAGIPPYNPGSWIVENPYGINESSILPGLLPALSRLLITLRENTHFRLLWSPAMYLYLGLFCAWILSARFRSWKLMLFMLPALVQSGILMVVNISADQFRYQYGVYLIGLISLGLLLINRISPEPETK